MNTENPWKFSSKRQDLHTGFVLFGRRYYLPEIGRWMTKDPLGNPESINRYAYNLNDPVNRIDPQGLFSFSTAATFLWGSFSSACRSISRGVNNLVHHLSFSEHIRPSIDEAGKFLLGENFLQLSGYYQDTSEMGIHGNGEINDKVRITLINGILNARIDYKESIDLISETHGGANVHYIFDATQGFCWDILKGLFVKSGFISPQAYQIAEVWREMIDEMGGVGKGGMIYHYAHSLGGVHTKAALRLMTPEEKNMIRIFTFGSASLISDDSVNGVYNYVSVRDGICFLDPIEYVSGVLGFRKNIIPVGEWLGIPFIDHMLESSAYEEVIRMLGHHFVYIYTPV